MPRPTGPRSATLAVLFLVVGVVLVGVWLAQHGGKARRPAGHLLR